jgi:hypothetical protein
LNQINLDILKGIFNWVPIFEISENEMQKLAEKMNIDLPKNFLLKCSWSYYKKCTVFSLEKKPLIFFKVVRDNYFHEIFGLHLTRYFLDADLCFKSFLTGLYEEKKSPIPYIATIYERGEHIGHKKYNVSDFRYYLGRQCYLHEILSLYDVYDRHFIVRDDNSLCRIDFDRSFENMDKDYLGFQDYLKKKRLDYDNDVFQEGYNKEQEIIKKNLENKRCDLIKVLEKVGKIKQDYELIRFDPKKFINQLIIYWNKISVFKELQFKF